MDGSPEGATSVDDMIARGADDFDFEAAWRAVQPDDVVTLIYTSGTTGQPQGVEMTTPACCSRRTHVDEVLGIDSGTEARRSLPSAHIADRMGGLYPAGGVRNPDDHGVRPARSRGRCRTCGRRYGGRCRGCGRSSRRQSNSRRRQTSPTRPSAGPAVGSGVAAKKAAALVADGPSPTTWRTEWAQADELVLSKLRDKLGLEQVRWAVRARRRSRRRRWGSSPASEYRSPRSGACRS